MTIKPLMRQVLILGLSVGLLVGCSSGSKVAECANGRKIPLHPSMVFDNERSPDSPFGVPGSKLHSRYYNTPETQENLIKFYESSLPTHKTRPGKTDPKETEIVDLPAGAKEETGKDVIVKVRPGQSGTGSVVEIFELVTPP